MNSLDDARKALADLEAMAEVLGCYSVAELRPYVESIVRKADAMEYSDVSGPEAVLVAALILRLRRRVRGMESELHRSSDPARLHGILGPPGPRQNQEGRFMTKAYDHHREWCAVETDAPYCNATGAAYSCTLKAGHPGEHQACAGHQIIRAWPNTSKDETQERTDGETMKFTAHECRRFCGPVRCCCLQTHYPGGETGTSGGKPCPCRCHADVPAPIRAILGIKIDRSAPVVRLARLDGMHY